MRYLFHQIRECRADVRYRSFVLGPTPMSNQYGCTIVLRYPFRQTLHGKTRGRNIVILAISKLYLIWPWSMIKWFLIWLSIANLFLALGNVDVNLRKLPCYGSVWECLLPRGIQIEYRQPLMTTQAHLPILHQFHHYHQSINPFTHDGNILSQ
jgi:hypothetical protein